MLEECWSRREYNEKRKMRFLSKKNEQKVSETEVEGIELGGGKEDLRRRTEI